MFFKEPCVGERDFNFHPLLPFLREKEIEAPRRQFATTIGGRKQLPISTERESANSTSVVKSICQLFYGLHTKVYNVGAILATIEP